MTTVAHDVVAGEALRLDDERALDASVVGSKAANLAAARRAGLPVLDGFVVPVKAAAALADGAPLPATVLAEYVDMSAGGRRHVVVRSSSPNEDTATSSKAGMFTSLVDVRGVAEFGDALATVAASGGGQPMAVLVQRHLDPEVAGIAFGLDPVSGETDRFVVSAVRGGPQALVGGAVAGDCYELGRHGRLRSFHAGDGGTRLGRRTRRRLASLVAAASRARGGPQDVEWAAAANGEVVLLQTRPVTTRPEAAGGPRYTTGPLAETFPAPLSRLEQELWLPPLETALRAVAVLTGRASQRATERHPTVVAPGGRAALDLDVFEGARRAGAAAVLDPRPQVRRLRAAWRVGRLARAIEAIAADVLAGCDAALAAVPELEQLDDRELLRVLECAGPALTSLHGHEILAGELAAEAGPTGAEAALHAIRQARRAGIATDDIVAAHPVVLALSAPRIQAAPTLPADVPEVAWVDVGQLRTREALRLRVRWVHELTVRVAHELGRRLSGRGILTDAAEVRHLRRADLAAAVAGDSVAVDPAPVGPPLPSVFHLDHQGTAVAVAGDRDPVGTGAGGGRGSGPVHHGDDPPPGAVLVVGVLEPRLAPLLPELAGLVAETGSPLSHLAILAREHSVPTVVAALDARRRWAPGDVVVVDGTTGEVAAVDDARSAS